MKGTWLEHEDMGQRVVGSNLGTSKVFHSRNLRQILPSQYMVHQNANFICEQQCKQRLLCNKCGKCFTWLSINKKSPVRALRPSNVIRSRGQIDFFQIDLFFNWTLVVAPKKDVEVWSWVFMQKFVLYEKWLKTNMVKMFSSNVLEGNLLACLVYNFTFRRKFSTS